MGGLQEFWLGVQAYTQVLPFVKRHGLQKWIWLPGLFNLLLFGVVAMVGFVWAGHAATWLTDYFGLQNPENWWQQAIEVVLPWLVRLAVLLLFWKTYKYLMLIFMAPILPMIAEQVQQILTGQPAPAFSSQRFFSDLKRGVVLSLKNLLAELSLTLPLYLLQFVFPISLPLTLAALLLIESYFLGVGLTDVHLEYLGYSVTESNTYMKQHRGLAIGNGLVLWAWLYLPLLGVLTGPSAGVIAAGLAMQKLAEKSA